MARLVGVKGIDAGVVVDVHDDVAADLIASGDYKVDDSDNPGAKEEGVLQTWGAHEDYSVHGVRDRGDARNAASEPKSAPKAKSE